MRSNRRDLSSLSIPLHHQKLSRNLYCRSSPEAECAVHASIRIGCVGCTLATQLDKLTARRRKLLTNPNRSGQSSRSNPFGYAQRRVIFIRGVYDAYRRPRIRLAWLLIRHFRYFQVLNEPTGDRIDWDDTEKKSSWPSLGRAVLRGELHIRTPAYTTRHDCYWNSTIQSRGCNCYDEITTRHRAVPLSSASCRTSQIPDAASDDPPEARNPPKA